MHWLVLILSGALEAVWATALAASDGFRRPRPTALFAVALVLSMAGLAWAMTGLPAGTAYAVWVGIGAVGTVLLAVARREERLDLGRAAAAARARRLRRRAQGGGVMPWVVLLASAVLEAVWASALAASDGPQHPRARRSSSSSPARSACSASRTPCAPSPSGRRMPCGPVSGPRSR